MRGMMLVGLLMVNGVTGISAHAGLVTTTVTATVGNQYSGGPVSSLSTGDTVTFALTYDDDSTAMHIFNADGSIQETFELTNYPQYWFFSDISSVAFSANVQSLFSELGKTYHDPDKYFYDLAAGEINASGTEMLNFSLASNAEYHIILPDVLGSINDDGDIYLQRDDGQPPVGFDLLQLRSTTSPVVPAPSSLTCLIGVGMMLGGVEWLKKRKHRVRATA